MNVTWLNRYAANEMVFSQFLELTHYVSELVTTKNSNNQHLFRAKKNTYIADGNGLFIFKSSLLSYLGMVNESVLLLNRFGRFPDSWIAQPAKYKKIIIRSPEEIEITISD